MNRVIKGKLNKVLSIVLSAAMIIGTVSFLPQSAWEAYADTVSEEKGAFTVTAETQDDLDAVTYDSSSGTLTFGADTAGKSYTIKQTDGVDTATSDRITINGGTTESPVTIKLDGVNIDGSDMGVRTKTWTLARLRKDCWNVFKGTGNESTALI